MPRGGVSTYYVFEPPTTRSSAGRFWFGNDSQLSYRGPGLILLALDILISLSEYGSFCQHYLAIHQIQSYT
jgi:hypothetical protein